MKKSILLILTISALFFTACTKSTAKIDPDSYNIVTSFYPIYILTLNIAEGIDNVNVINMAQPQTGCLHDYQLTTKDMKTLDSADIFIINGAGMESFMSEAFKLYPQLKIADSSKGIELVEASGDHSDHEHNHEDNDFEEYNSHIWLSVPNAIKQVENIKNSLCEADPNNSEYYTSNADDFKSKLETLYSETNELDISNTQIATFHEGFDYIAKDYNLTIGATIQLDENIQPSARQLGEATENVKNAGITALFVGDETGKKLAETIAAETNSNVYLLNPLTSGNMSADEYINAIKSNYEIIKEALK